MDKQINYWFALIGGIITLAVALVVIAFSPIMALATFFVGGIAGAMFMVYGVWGVICGIMMIVAANMIKQKQKDKIKTGYILLLVFSLLALITMEGVIIGPLFGLIAAILGLLVK